LVEIRDAGDLRFTGLRFVVTGRLDSLSRQEAQGRIKELGGAVSSSVSGKTNYVVVGADPGSKYDSAIRLNVPVLEEDQFLRFLDGEVPDAEKTVENAVDKPEDAQKRYSINP
jgi:DNA ligase (NAD+)